MSRTADEDPNESALKHTLNIDRQPNDFTDDLHVLFPASLPNSSLDLKERPAFVASELTHHQTIGSAMTLVRTCIHCLQRCRHCCTGWRMLQLCQSSCSRAQLKHHPIPSATFEGRVRLYTQQLLTSRSSGGVCFTGHSETITLAEDLALA